MKKNQVHKRHEAHRIAPVRLVHITSLADADGEPRVALELPPIPGAVSRRPALQMFTSLALALAAKRQLEGGAA